MKAFHGDKAIKKKYVNRVLAHQKADRIIQGTGWDDLTQKGCAVGCTLENYNHKQFEIELGIPEWLARVEDRIFEGLPKDKALLWPAKFLKAVNVGADLEKVKAPFLIFILQSSLEKLDHTKYPNVIQAINSVIDLYVIGEATIEDFGEARTAATDAAKAAAAAAADADAAYATDAAKAAAAAAADADAVYAAYAAADAAYAANAAARHETWIKFANKLLRLIKDCK